MSNEATSTVAVVGLGAMGSRIAAVLHRTLGRVTVWNRDPRKCDALEEAGATVAESFTDASEAEVVLLAVSSYAVVDELLSILSGPRPLAGRVVVNIVTGTADDARRTERIVEDLGGRYLDGGNMCYPRSIGVPDGCILYSGDEQTWRAVESVLQAIAPAQRWLGPDAGLANTSYLLAWNVYFAAVGAYHETRPLAHAMGLDDREFGAAVHAVFARLRDFLDDATDRVVSGDYSADQATIATHVAGSRARASLFSSHHLPGAYADTFLAMLEGSVDRGASELDINALSASSSHPTK